MKETTHNQTIEEQRLQIRRSKPLIRSFPEVTSDVTTYLDLTFDTALGRVPDSMHATLKKKTNR